MTNQAAKTHLPLLPTSVVGSYSVPEWLERLKTDFYLHRISSAHLNEIHDVAIKAAIKDQEQAGIDVVSDGELRRDNDIDYLLARIPGVSILNPAKSYYYDYFEAEVPEPLSSTRQESSELGLVEDFVFTRSQTERPIKFSFTGPFSLSRRIRNSAYRDQGELVRSLAYALNAEARKLVSAGATRLQIDEPFLAGYPDDVGLAIDAINLVTKAVDADWALHVCYGNRHARPSWEGHYDFLFPAVLDAEVGTLVLEFARKGYEDLSLFARYPWERRLGLGVVDVKSEDVEIPDVVAGRIRRALDVVPAERLIINPDCGLRHLPATVARAKLRAMVTGAAGVRRELAGSPSSQPSTANEES
ncbi:MAG: methionine synthase [Actinomycetota bacterium]|nr:methionine synthase [Actinomycetota bacterium]